MISNKITYQVYPAGRNFLTIALMSLLLLLTTANYFAALSNESENAMALGNSPEEDSEAFPGTPGGPDEKSPGNPVSISEEFLHGHCENNELFMTDQFFTHLISVSEKIELVHFELLSPPPEC
jgi:hypothetical protein